MKEKKLTGVCLQRMYEEGTIDGVYGTLYDRFALTVFTYICQHVSNVQDAEDLLVEVFLAAFKNEGLSSLPVTRQAAWLLRVTRNKLVDRHRHHALVTLVPIELASDVEDGAPTPEQYAEQQENMVICMPWMLSPGRRGGLFR